MALVVGLVVLAASYGAGIVCTGGRRMAIADDVRRAATVYTIGFAVLANLALFLGSVAWFRKWLLAASLLRWERSESPLLSGRLRAFEQHGAVSVASAGLPARRLGWLSSTLS